MSRLMRSIVKAHNDHMIQFVGPTVTEQRFGQVLKVPKLWCLKAPVALYEVVVTCVTPEGRPHPHRLEGPHCRDGICVMRGGNSKELSYVMNRLHIGTFKPVPGLKIHLAGEKYKQVRRIRRTFKSAFTSRDTMLDYLINPILFLAPREIMKVAGIKVKPVDEKGVKASLNQKERLEKMETMFSRPKERRNPSDPFNMGFSHKHSKVDLSTIKLSFDVTILRCDVGESGITVFSPFSSDAITDTAPRILDMSERECPVGVQGGRPCGVLRQVLLLVSCGWCIEAKRSQCGLK